jgi:hypothetical protein
MRWVREVMEVRVAGEETVSRGDGEAEAYEAEGLGSEG